ncbi:putative cobalamin biosynthesis protein, CobT [Caballeronia sordidicola]|uniref:Putative cobalamin biosynthesis protein, CobT n=1 Tax=Caballeronia sordidicola TaxID=196367 RepID=A0A158IFY0_CABSO|nr:VWA domain-containing protein [Caballeronia sordidicola]SAL55484.1 putative cobalamin biosynthesis protein, CobT [Caballeronia sordidicola]
MSASPLPQLAPDTLSRLARVLTGRYGVTVSFDAHGPRVECDRIVLPESAVPDSLNADALTGQLDLLAARWKFSAIDRLDALPPGPARQLAQVIEDRRVCERLFNDYPGARGYIGTLRKQKARATHARWPTLPWRDKLIWLIEGALWSETPAVTERTPALDATLGAVSDALNRARASRSTRESIENAQALVKRIRSLGAGGVNTMMFTADADETLDAERVHGDQDATLENAQETQDAATADAALASQTPSDATAQPSEAQSPAAAISFDMVDGRPRLSIPLTTAFDIVTDLTGRGDPAAWRNLRALARAETAPLTARLERALKADEQTHWKRDQERGEIDRPALVKLVLSPGYRTPFRVKRITEGRDAAVTLLIDRSGSMAGKKMDLARLCAAALCDALIQLSFKCEVLGYSSVESPEMRALYEQMLADGADLSRYNRKLERLDLQVYKRFGSNNAAGLSEIACGHENPDGEALVWAASRLLAQRANRRILMVLSDGYPATGDGHPVILQTDLRARIEEIAASGVELIGIGLLDDAVEKFYAHNIVVRKLDELPTMAFTVLSDLLLRKRTSV